MTELKSLDRLKTSRRRAVPRAGETVKTERLGDRSLPLALVAQVPDAELVAWASKNHEKIAARLLEHGGLLFRGFRISTAALPDLMAALAGDLLTYSDRATPRSQVEGRVYTSTDYAAEEVIELHNESCYGHAFPQKIAFYCERAAETGGETPIADCRRILESVDCEVVERFVEKRIAYVRNFGPGLGPSWREAFGVEDRDELAALCRERDMRAEWWGDDRLRIRQVRDAVARHPETGERIWFNQAVAFHVTTLPDDVREPLEAELAPSELPKNALYGDGTPIEREELDHLRAVYRTESVAFPWREGDVMLLDNLLAAHGRRPYRGERQIRVAMAQSRTWEEVRA